MCIITVRVYRHCGSIPAALLAASRQFRPVPAPPPVVTVAGTSYTLGSSAVASQVSSLNGGGVGEVVTLLLGMNNEAAGIVTGEEADSVFYGVVQTATRSLVEENGADVLQKVSVMCTDGIARTVNVDKSLNYSAGVAGARSRSPRRARAWNTIDDRPRQRHDQYQCHCAGRCRNLARRCSRFWIQLRRVWLGRFVPAAYPGRNTE